jgi:hypothetical protein
VDAQTDPSPAPHASVSARLKCVFPASPAHALALLKPYHENALQGLPCRFNVAQKNDLVRINKDVKSYQKSIKSHACSP